MASLKHLLHQGPVIASLGKTALAALRQSRGGGPAPGAAPTTPGPLFEATIPPRSPDLVRAYLREVGGDPGAWRGALPPHMFPQSGGSAPRKAPGPPPRPEEHTSELQAREKPVCR